MSIIYRYHCATTGDLVWETKAVGEAAPTVCKDESGAITAGSLTIVTQPTELEDVEIFDTADFGSSTVSNLSHTELDDIGTNTHAQIDTHIADATQHRTINDSGTASTDLWSGSKISGELAGKSATGHTHTASDVTDFDTEVGNHTDVAASTTHRGRTDNPHSVTKAQVGLGDVENVKTNLVATTNPGASNDTNSGYGVGSVWVNTTTKLAYKCVNASAGAAEWVLTTLAVNDTTPSATTTYSSNKVVTELATKSNTGHTHTTSNITDFTTAVSAHSDVSANNSHRINSSNPHAVTKAQVGLGDVTNIKSKYDATGDPTVDNDTTEGYSAGSKWVNTTSEEEFVCVNPGDGVAVWIRTTLAIDDSSASSTTTYSSNKIETAFAPVSHTHTASEITDFSTAADARITVQKAAANGLATLDGNSKIPTSQLPDLSITNVSVVADITARDALTVQEGDVAKVTDSDGSGNPGTYIYDGTVWVDIQESSNVISVNNQTGVVSLDTDDLNEGSSNLYYTETRVNANTNVTTNTTHRGLTTNPHGVTINQATSALTMAKGSLLGHNGSAHTKVVVGSNKTVLQADSSQASGFAWVANPKFIVANQKKAINNTGIWVAVDDFIYPGATITAANVTQILINAYTDNASNNFDIRVVDVSTAGAPVVALKTNNSNIVQTVIDLNGQSLVIPSTNSIFEVQIKKNSGAGSIFIRYHSSMLSYQ